ncbi:MAG: M20/M25/M40 family metallo-hydrolase [Chitinophagales bacterium]|nr:M20/M25/M40 family metallo-hydrolase [Chitinophagales bacterium]
MKSITFIVYLFLNAFSLFAQYRSEAMEIVDTLASPEMKGRGYTGDGNKKAAVYIKNAFENIGLKNYYDSYFQEFKIDVNTFPSEITLVINDTELKAGEDFIVHAASGEINGKFKLQQIDSTYILDISKAKKILNNSKKDELLLFYKKDLGNQYNDLVQLLMRTDCLNRAGVIEITDEKLTMNIAMEQLPYAHFIVHTSEKIPTQVKTVTAKMEPRFIKNYETQNVIGFIEGKEKKDSLLVFSAHYDHLGVFGDDTYFPGANDNASGIAMLLQLAEYFSKAENQSAYTIAFIAFGGEEIGLVGSKYFTDYPLFELSKIKFLINMDIVGTGDDGIKVVNGAVHTEHFNNLVKLNNENNFLKSVQPRGKAANSDHYFFTEKGVPAFFIYTLGGIAAYHDVYDKPETLPLTEFDDLFKLLTAFVRNYE